MTGIFESTARAYWAAGLPAIPLIEGEKRPVITNWSEFANRMPTSEEQEAWLAAYPNGNIGVVLGPQAGLVMIDIDTEDEALARAIQEALPPSPWSRIGKKGMMLAYRFSGLQTFRIKDIGNKMIVEHLSTRTQIVLPPSIHPETKKPYVANAALPAMLDKIVALPPDVESTLRGLCGTKGVKLSHSGWTKTTDHVAAGSRDVTMTSMAGIYAGAVIRGERTLKEAIQMLRVWGSEFVEEVPGDPLDIEKGVKNLLKFISRDVKEKNRVLPKDWDKDLTAEEKQGLGFELTEDEEEWSADRVKEYLIDVFANCPPSSTGRLEGIDKALKKIAVAKNMGAINKSSLLTFISEASAMQIKMSSLKERMRELEKSGIDGVSHAEIAKAVISDMEQTQQIAFYKGDFVGWNGSHWDKYTQEEQPQLISQKLKHLIVENYGSMQAGKKHNDHVGILKTAATLLPQEIKTLDVKGVNFSNGIVLENLKLMAHDPAYGMTYTLPFRYVPEDSHRAQKFFDFLQQCWGLDEDYEEKVMAVQEMICATIFGIATRYQRAFLLYGAPKSGKSQMLRIIECLVPDNGRSYCPPDQWGERFSPETMVDKVLNICGELSDRKLIDSTMFKQIIPGERISTEKKGKDRFNFSPICAHWFASNHLPRSDDTSSGFIRRWLVLTFNHTVDPSKRVVNLGDLIVAEEREAIAAWAIEALPRLLKNQEYTLPKSHKRVMNDVASANNSIRHFLVDSGVVKFGSMDQTIHEAKLYNAYFQFCCGPGGVKAFSQKAFRVKIKELTTEFPFEQIYQPDQTGLTADVFYRGLQLGR
jgi:putative DNA primase/helicase